MAPLTLYTICVLGAVALYMMLRAAGHARDESLERIAQARSLTAHELRRKTRRRGRLVDAAEALFAELSPRARERSRRKLTARSTT